jgi:hypothetical protein
VSRQEAVVVLVAGILTATMVGVSGVWNYDRISSPPEPIKVADNIWEQPRIFDKNGCTTVVLFEDGTQSCVSIAA